MLSPQPFISHHFTTHTNFSHKVSFLPPSLHFTSLHFTSLHFTSLHFTSLHFTSFHFTSFHFTTILNDFYFILLRFTTLSDDFQHTLSSFNSPRLSISLPSMHTLPYQIKKNEIGGACGRYGWQEWCRQDFGGEKWGQWDHLEDVGIDGSITLTLWRLTTYIWVVPHR